ncbi:hypothetical protein [Peribacillus frigoritolerans]|uniref:Uncharacterized protein n=1 Tax=Peribacillus castrilensis TaxID=2897690 RepID=A0AAW9NAP3_9BACI|nr:hypothetical protein [Peribacillus castrilensis]MEC0297770.1 hypothetical protein [Peribacillus castrilensis]
MKSRSYMLVREGFLWIQGLPKESKSIKAIWEQLGNFEPEPKGNENIREFLEGYFSTRTDHTISWFEELIKRIKTKEL